MIHINRSKKTGQFIVITTGNNNEKLNSSELLKTKQSAWKNIKADLGQKNGNEISVQDNTGNSVVLYKFNIVFGKTKCSALETDILVEQIPNIK